MQASKAIELLQKYYAPDEQIIITWWDKDNVASYHLNRAILDDEWEELVEIYENGDESVSEAFSNEINWIADNRD